MDVISLKSVKSNRNLFISIIVCFVLMIQLITSILGINSYSIYMITVLELLPLSYVMIDGFKIEKNFLLLCIIMGLCACISSVYHMGNFKIFVHTISAIVLGFAFAKYNINLKVSWIMFLICFFLIGIRLMYVDTNRVFANSSRNAISHWSLLFAIIVYIAYGIQKRYSLVPAVLTFLICLTSGRSGVLASMVLLGGVILINLRNKRYNKIAIIRGMIVFFLITVFAFVGSPGNKFLMIVKQRLVSMKEKKLTEDSRVQIIIEYGKEIAGNICNLVFGVDRNRFIFPSAMGKTSNFHNSFLFLHSNYGILGFLCVVGLLIICVKKSINNRNYMLALGVFVICIRSFFDWVSFFSIYDPIMYAFCFLAMKKNKHMG